MESVVVKKNEEKIITVLWTGEETEVSYDIMLTEPGASIKFLGLLIGKDTQSLNMHVTVTHEAPQTTSKVIIKSALTDSAKVDIEGLVKINPGAKGTNAWLAAHLLLLSEKAKGRAVPSLEILENDIKAGHATTVGRINDMEIFYLMSRGISRQTAKSLIVEGFLQEMISQFPDNLAKKAQLELTI
ncbi:MAG TPA: SufD family Fe-S cluster assembly protein [Candidatus Saccharimonadales bacterium]|nr:SufD family Fe-S cluster assembly protein [Candidatus Saccharimonadales bacterium]